jgi:hypothetical protein
MKYEQFNRLMDLCRVETVFVATVTSVKLKYTKLQSRSGFREYAILKTDDRPSIVVWPEDWAKLKETIVVGLPMMFFVSYPTAIGRQQKPAFVNGSRVYPPSFQWVLNDVQAVSMIDEWLEVVLSETVYNNLKGNENDE